METMTVCLIQTHLAFFILNSVLGYISGNKSQLFHLCPMVKHKISQVDKIHRAVNQQLKV